MISRTILPILLLVLTLGGCATTKEEGFDKFTGIRILKSAEISADKVGLLTSVRFNFKDLLIQETGQRRIQLTVRTSEEKHELSSHTKFGKGAPLYFIIDGKRITLHSAQSGKQGIHTGWLLPTYSEQVIYKDATALLKALMNAQTVEFRLVGRNDKFEGKISPKSIAKLRAAFSQRFQD